MPDLTAITETRLTKESSIYQVLLPGYHFVNSNSMTKAEDVGLYTEMGIYRDNLSAITFTSIIVIAQNSLDLLITVIAFVIYFVIADKLLR